MPAKKVLITGGNGFIGTHLSAAYLKLGSAVGIVSRRNFVSAHTQKAPSYFVGDVGDIDFFSRVLKEYEPEVVIHLAALLKRSEIPAQQVFDENVRGTHTVIEGIVSASKKARLILIGTLEEVAGSLVPLSESSPLSPISRYSLSKACATIMVQYAVRHEGLKASVVRLPVVYGPGQSPGMFIPNCIIACLNGERFTVLSGEQERNFIFVDDVVRGIIAVDGSRIVKGDILHLDGGPENLLPIKDVAERIRSACKNGTILYGELVDTSSEIFSYATDSSATMKKLPKWRPTVSIDEGLEKTISWYKAHFI
ncbi:MAG: hypothetical protein COV08_02425 [Candidatus Vogelbacteria bacterium CG10_big_fil_rev_8_21_14_0_10_49_38]|uniref:NAD-dependent epimerase/dehydratase domain-containing protein n=1 Tax=Candidatus Vogelbacteria bacterium CG10_big_fil_rev_8_21_14_0_10_49_38 TaxID=1975043 RepID=A0A2H0RHA8_9BACT|nr:MAG: hypothetical protein BK006_02445 [bacterium CG10_49_38]PIR45919.1 MAG: hypothetical protein COV08_02425 [Candidatus Vogelbacteria bacterium CG10_big_fil_rev_8_21_14_0_10_49_38]